MDVERHRDAVHQAAWTTLQPLMLQNGYRYYIVASSVKSIASAFPSGCRDRRLEARDAFDCASPALYTVLFAGAKLSSIRFVSSSVKVQRTKGAKRSYGPRAHRKPTSWWRGSGGRLTRHAARRSRAPPWKEPPRTARPSPRRLSTQAEPSIGAPL